MDKTDTKNIVQRLKTRGEPACYPGRLSGAEHDSAPVLAETSNLGAARTGCRLGELGWTHQFCSGFLPWDPAPSPAGSTLPLRLAGGSSCIPGSRLVVLGDMELVELRPWDGGF